MRIVVGTDNGLLKTVNVEKQLLLGAWGTLDASLRIDQLYRDDPDPSTMETIFTAKKCGVVEQWNIENGSMIKRVILPKITTKLPHRYTGLYHFNQQNEGSILVANNFGDVHVLPFDQVEGSDQSPEPIHTCSMEGQFEAVRVNFHNETEFAAGGEETPLRVWDIATGKRTWNSRNLRDNSVGLAPKIWVRDLAYVPHHPQQIVTATSYSQIRLYDTKAQRRPMFNEEVGKNAFSSICPTPDGNYVLVGDVMGNINKFDLRQRKSLGTFKGKTVGSVREISCHPTEPLFACSSLDRHLRVFDHETREMKMKLYLKQRLHGCAFLKENAADEDEETWGQLPEVGSDDDTRGDEDLSAYMSDSDSGDDLAELTALKRKKKSKKTSNRTATPSAKSQSGVKRKLPAKSSTEKKKRRTSSNTK